MLPDSEMGRKLIRLNAPPLALLANHSSALHSLEKPWRPIRAIAKLEDIRRHDWCHSFASEEKRHLALIANRIQKMSYLNRIR